MIINFNNHGKKKIKWPIMNENNFCVLSGVLGKNNEGIFWELIEWGEQLVSFGHLPLEPKVKNIRINC